MVECDLAKVDVAGSNPVSRFTPGRTIGWAFGVFTAYSLNTRVSG